MGEFPELIFLALNLINNMTISLNSKRINSFNFQKYGDLITVNNKDYTEINNGYAFKFDDLAEINVSENLGKANISIYKSKPRSFPMKIEMLEKHPLGTQAFFPLNNQKYLIVVAPLSDIPLTKTIESFIVPPQTGINYKKGIWHYPLISLIESNFLVIDRKGPENNLKIFNFKNEIITLNYE